MREQKQGDLGVKTKVKNIELVEFEHEKPQGSKLFDKDYSIVGNVKVKLEIVIGEAELSIAELFQLQSNSIITLMQHQEAPIQLRLDGKTIAYGNLVLVGENYGLRIIEIMDK